ncbi:MAG: argininosuccinate synthase, partial [Planctomycetota bacterium]
EKQWLTDQGLPIPGSGAAKYSLNQGLWGVSIGGGETLTSSGPLPEEAWLLTARDRHVAGERAISIEFSCGVPIALDGRKLTPVQLIEELNHLAGRYGVGRGYHLGDTVLGIKGRIGYEAPAAETLIEAHRELEKLVLTQAQRATKDALADDYGRQLHAGQAFEPQLRDIEALFASSQSRVTGTVQVLLGTGKALVIGLESPFSMMSASGAVYGESPDRNSNPAGALWLARTMAEPARLWRRAGELAIEESTGGSGSLAEHTLQPQSEEKSMEQESTS